MSAIERLRAATNGNQTRFKANASGLVIKGRERLPTQRPCVGMRVALKQLVGCGRGEKIKGAFMLLSVHVMKENVNPLTRSPLLRSLAEGRGSLNEPTPPRILNRETFGNFL